MGKRRQNRQGTSVLYGQNMNRQRKQNTGISEADFLHRPPARSTTSPQPECFQQGFDKDNLML